MHSLPKENTLAIKKCARSIAAILLLFFCGRAGTQETKPRENPCIQDVDKYCSSLKTFRDKVGCLKGKRAHISENCRAYIDSFFAFSDKMWASCKNDSQKFCGKPGTNVFSCLLLNREELSPVCGKDLDVLIGIMPKAVVKTFSKQEKSPAKDLTRRSHSSGENRTLRHLDNSQPRRKTPEVKNAEVVLVGFPDVKPGIKRDEVVRKFAQLDEYIQEMSYGKVSLKSRVTTKWYTLPRPLSTYRLPPQNLKVNETPVQALLQDVIDVASADVPLHEAPYVFFYLSADKQQYGMACLYLYPGCFDWQSPEPLKTPDGKEVAGQIAVFNSRAFIGNIVHDALHELGGKNGGRRGVPCLYDQNIQAGTGNSRKVFVSSLIYMGFWDPMSCHCYKCGTEPTMGISSWTKLRLGWIPENKIRTAPPERTTEVLLGPLEDFASRTLVVKIPLTEHSYYLIENRQPIGYDRFLPGSGVLILYADDRFSECMGGTTPVQLVNADPSVPLLKGAAFSLNGTREFADKTNGVKIELLSMSGAGYNLRISPLNSRSTQPGE